MREVKDTKNERLFYPTVSMNVVKYLQEEKLMTLSRIAELLEVHKSFTSRVRKGERSFTLSHLEKLAKALDKPLSVLIMEATPIESAPKDLEKLYAAFRALMAKLSQALEVESSDPTNNFE